MQRLFSGFPAGAPGAGLVLLRLMLGVYLIAQGVRIAVLFVDTVTSPTILASLTALAMLVGGALGAAGILTPAAQITSVAAGLVTVIDTLWVPAAVPGFHVPWPLASVTTVMAVSLVFLGPGAYSIDAFLFGRKEISIPPLSGRFQGWRMVPPLRDFSRPAPSREGSPCRVPWRRY